MPRSRNGFLRWLETNQGVGALLTAILFAYLVYLQLVPWTHRVLRDGFTLGFFPTLGVLLMLIFTVTMIVDTHRKEAMEELGTIDWKGFLFCLAALAACFVCFQVMLWLGFLIAGPVFLFGMMYALGLREIKSAAIAAIVMTVAIYGLFRVIGITLPSGVLSFLGA